MFTRFWQLSAAIVACAMGTVPQPVVADEPVDPASAAAMRPFPLVYVVRYRAGAAYAADRPLLKQDLREHEKYMRRMTEAGTIIAAGPTFDETGGLVLIRVSSLADAEAFIRDDPAVIAKIFTGSATDWRPVFDAGLIFRPAKPPAD